MSRAASITDHPALAGLQVLQRGWLSSNNLLIPAADDEAGATLIDASHVTHAAQTVALLRHALAGAPLARVVNTHLHSDHCGGNAALQRAFGAQLLIPPGQADVIAAWDDSAPAFDGSGQYMERFVPDGLIPPGTMLLAGGRRFEALQAPGHDPHSLMFFDAAQGLLVSADALWENGFGVVFPEISGEPGFDDVGAVLDLIERLPVQVVVPGHGAPFSDVAGALRRARERLEGFRRDPMRHARHAVKVLIKYHLMEERAMDRQALLDWVAATPMMVQLWARFGQSVSESPSDWADGFVDELVRAGALGVREGRVVDVA